MNEDTQVGLSDTPSQESTTETIQTSPDTTVQATEQPTQTEQVEESFFDPKTVPEELLPAYKQMQAAFTKKTQEIASVRKEYEPFKTQAEKYAKYEQFIPVLDEMLTKQSQPQESAEMLALTQQLKTAGYSDDAIEMMKMGAGFILNQVNQSKASERFEQEIQKTNDLDPRLNDQSLAYQLEGGEKFTFGEMVSQITATIPNWRNDPVGATKKAIARVDALIGKSKTEGKQELSVSARQKAQQFPAMQTSPQSAVPNGQPQTMQEAAELAKQQLKI